MTERTVVVLGMHRSGTSLVTRILNLLGVELGPEARLMHPGPDNPVGFWEHGEFVALNKKILSQLGGNWHEPPVFEPGWEVSPGLSDLRGAALELIDREFGSAEIWGWKDPRTSLTVSFWQRLVPGMSYVICLRNPLDVAQSLSRRDGFSAAKAGRLWVTYVEASLRGTADRDPLIMFYEDVMADWPRELARLSAFIGEPEAAAFEHLQTAVWTAVHEELHHHRSSTREVVADPELPTQAKALHVVLRGYVDLVGGRGDVRPEIQEAMSGLRSSRRDRRALGDALSLLEAAVGEAAETQELRAVPLKRPGSGGSVKAAVRPSP
jgi:hypothetical protein